MKLQSEIMYESYELWEILFESILEKPHFEFVYAPFAKGLNYKAKTQKSKIRKKVLNSKKMTLKRFSNTSEILYKLKGTQI